MSYAGMDSREYVIQQQARVIADLRAHVAALVQAMRTVVENVDTWSIAQLRGYIRKNGRQALDTPDLAALVAREQARDAVVEAALRWKDTMDRPNGNDHCDAHFALVDAVITLRALDAAEKQP